MERATTTARQLGREVGAKPEQVERLTELSLPTLLAALKRNSSSQEGAEALARALDQHKDDAVDDVPRFLGKADANDGSKILLHMFGSDKERVQSTLARETGMNTDQVSRVLTKLAPLLLGMLGQQKAKQNLDSSGIAGLLSGLLGGLLSGLPGGTQTQQPSGFGSLLSSLIGARPAQTQQAAQLGIPALIEALRHNTRTEEGRSALAKALVQHEDDPVDDVAGV